MALIGSFHNLVKAILFGILCLANVICLLFWVVILGGYLFAGVLMGFSLDSDTKMIGHFNRHRDDFESLVQYVGSIKTSGRIDLKFLDPWDGESFDAETVSTVRRLLKRTGERQVILSPGDGIVTLLHDSVGLSISGASKSFVFVGDGVRLPSYGILATDTRIYDNFRKANLTGRSYVSYRQFSDHWYVEYDYED